MLKGLRRKPLPTIEHLQEHEETIRDFMLREQGQRRDLFFDLVAPRTPPNSPVEKGDKVVPSLPIPSLKKGRP